MIVHSHIFMFCDPKTKYLSPFPGNHVSKVSPQREARKGTQFGFEMCHRIAEVHKRKRSQKRDQSYTIELNEFGNRENGLNQQVLRSFFFLVADSLAPPAG